MWRYFESCYVCIALLMIQYTCIHIYLLLFLPRIIFAYPIMFGILFLPIYPVHTQHRDTVDTWNEWNYDCLLACLINQITSMQVMNGGSYTYYGSQGLPNYGSSWLRNQPLSASCTEACYSDLYHLLVTLTYIIDLLLLFMLLTWVASSMFSS